MPTKQTGTIPVLPTWRVVMEILCRVLENGTPEGKQQARDELVKIGARLDELTAMKHFPSGVE